MSEPHTPQKPRLDSVSDGKPLSFKRRPPRPSLSERLRSASQSILPGFLSGSPARRVQDGDEHDHPDDYALDDDDDEHRPNQLSRFLSRNRIMSSSSSFGGRSAHRTLSIGSPKPPIPHALPAMSATPDATPLPFIPITVLAICMLSEFLSASVTSPFIFFMIEDFGVGKGENGGGEAAVGFWSGIVGSCFFLSQFLTSLLWASASEKHGRRAVLFTSLLGNACTLAAFGTTKNLPQAICVRLGQGLFNGAIGVARGAIRDITDPTNEGKAYSVVGLAWALGGTVGPIAGGILEHPVENHPWLFGNSQLFKTYPYLLPCLCASSVIALGAFLSLFLSRDGGLRTGAIHLPPEKSPTTQSQADPSSPKTLRTRMSSIFGQNIRQGSPDISRRSSFAFSNRQQPIGSSSDAHHPPTSVGERNPLSLSRTNTHQSAVTGYGTAYGYEPSNRLTPLSLGGHRSSMRRYSNRPGFLRARTYSRASTADGAPSTQYAPDFDREDNEDNEHQERMRSLSFAQRLLLANEDAVFSISDVWVAAATRDDDGYSVANWDDDSVGDDDTGSVIEHSVDGNEDAVTIESGHNDSDSDNDENHIDPFGYEGANTPSVQPSYDDLRQRALHQSASFASPSRHATVDEQHNGQRAHDERRLSNFSDLSNVRRSGMRSTSAAGGGKSRRRSSGGYSSMSRPVGMYEKPLPAAYRNTGLSSPVRRESEYAHGGVLPVWNQQQQQQQQQQGGDEHTSLRALSPRPVSPTAGGVESTLPAIPEIQGMHQDTSASGGTSAEASVMMKEEETKRMSTWAVLPIAFIVQHALLAFHGTTMDQVFMSFLVTPYGSGGLGLTAIHYAELVAVMCVCNMYFQFRFYPQVGPPRGKLSHLAMFRLGLSLYIPAYLMFPMLRKLSNESAEEKKLVMTGMVLLSAFRYLANVCSYSSIMILTNAMTPPGLIPLANGLAQTAVSAARFAGPVLGGFIWSYSIADGPDARGFPMNYSLGFYVIACICATGLLLSMRIR